MNGTASQKESLKQLVTFSVKDEEFGLDILQVQEVLRLPQITVLPKAPSFIKGVIDLRGSIIPIIDLREKFGLDHEKYSDTTRVIIVDITNKKIGMVVDNVSQVVRVPESYISPPPSMIQKGITDYLDGVVRLEDRLIILLNVDALLSIEEIVQLNDVSNENIKEPVTV
ncbi:MAG: chemotaxis protein CheW [Spirochaetota bacterium]|nr:chemotaxis protein CheW [Spirochaetota bacterium]